MKIPSSRIYVAGMICLCLFAQGCIGTPKFIRVFTLPSISVTSAMMNDANFPDKRRRGVNETVIRSAGKRPPYTQKYLQMAQADPDFTVRAIAIRALNRSRDASATPLFVHSLSDANFLVRLEAVKALNRLPDPAAVPLLITHLQPSYDTGALDDRGVAIEQDESQDVRIASAEALSHYKGLNVARALVDMLDSRDFGIASEARNSLREITGKDFGYDQAAWLNYLSAPGHPLG